MKLSFYVLLASLYAICLALTPVENPGDIGQASNPDKDFRNGVIVVFEPNEQNDKQSLVKLHQFITKVLDAEITQTFDELVFGYTIKWNANSLSNLYQEIGKLINEEIFLIDDVTWINTNIKKLLESVTGKELTIQVNSDASIK